MAHWQLSVFLLVECKTNRLSLMLNLTQLVKIVPQMPLQFPKMVEAVSEPEVLAAQVSEVVPAEEKPQPPLRKK